MNDRVVVTIDAHVAEVRLNRQGKLNALDLPMFEALGDAADRVRGERSVRAVVLYGTGDNFCAGIDLAVLADAELDFATALAPVAPSAANVFQRAAYAWRELPIPVICAIRGVAFGGGLQVALGADIRYASPDAKFSIMEANWGIIPDMAISATLRHLLAPDRVKELSWSARIFGSEEARELGLITSVVEDPLRASREMARRCAEKSPQAIRGIKSLVNQAWQMPEQEALALEARLQGRIIGSDNQREAVQARLQERPPEFED